MIITKKLAKKYQFIKPNKLTRGNPLKPNQNDNNKTYTKRDRIT